MSRRDKLIGLMCVEALVWLATSVMQMYPESQPRFAITYGGAAIIGMMFAVIQVALLFAPAVLIGTLSRQWQGSIALNMLAIAPAFALAVAGQPYAQRFGGLPLAAFAVVAALGFLGWLLRFVRLEFTD
ncbi:MAG TPA: hypothetical protein VE338_06795 [Ktedonobacterales bacterium]|jgi:hypothetical protein|nr:hypothetical protein [Ktedonobacterales bacterium]